MMGFEPTVSNSTSYCITFLLHLLYSLFLSHLFFLFSRLLPIRPSFFTPSFLRGDGRGMVGGWPFPSLSSFPFSSPFSSPGCFVASERGSSSWLFLVLFLPFSPRSFSGVLSYFFLLRFFFLSIFVSSCTFRSRAILPFYYLAYSFLSFFSYCPFGSVPTTLYCSLSCTFISLRDTCTRSTRLSIVLLSVLSFPPYSRDSTPPGATPLPRCLYPEYLSLFLSISCTFVFSQPVPF